MKYVRFAASVAALSCLVNAQSVGPDVIVGDLIDTGNYGSNGGIYAYAIGTYSCNIGNAQLNWFAGPSNLHPVIGQGIYRYFPGNAAQGQYGRLEQVGMSWLKHGFTALTDNLCQTCQNPFSGGTTLGIGCADPYVASLNGSASGLGPRYQVNPFTGVYPSGGHPTPTGNATIAGRIQVLGTDLDANTWPGSQWFGEGQYVTQDDAAAGNHFNNASWRPATVAGANNTFTLTGATHRMQPAILAWQQADPGVDIKTIDVPGEGRFYVGYRSTSLSPGVWHHEYAVFNLNSDRAGASFSVALPAGVVATTGANHFHDVPYHSGEIQVGTDWALTNAAGSSISWAVTSSYPAPPASDTPNALRWGTMYNFRFDANTDWLPNVTIGLYKPGSPSSVSGTMCRRAGLSTAPIAGPSYTSVAYDFVDATSGTAGPAGDDAGMVVTLPFTFTYWGQPLTQLTISTNGYLAGPAEPGGEYNNASVPNSAQPNNLIAAYWDDLEIGTSGGAAGSATGWCRYLTTGTAPNRRFVVEWFNAQIWGANVNFAFEVIIDEATSDVTVTQISTGTNTTGGSATRGVENASGSAGVQLSYNTAGSAAAGTSYRFTTNTPLTYGPTALLTMTGDGSFANPFHWHVTSDPNSALSLFVDVAPGPVYIPILQANLGIGLTPGMVALADATGLFGPADPTAITSACDGWDLYLPVSNVPIPPSLIDLWFQGLVWSASAPNGFAHVTTVATY